MSKFTISFTVLILLFAVACGGDDFDREVEIPEFNFPQTVVFEDSLSAYQIFEGAPADLEPADDFEVLELSSSLFSDYSRKQRLVKIPVGTQLKRSFDNTLEFPNGTLLTKTFYFNKDDRDASLGKRIIETRLLIKEDDRWNAASYQWNEAQTAATLALDETGVEVSWINSLGATRSTEYLIPSQNQCMTCHQSNDEMTPLGPTALNLNRNVLRNGADVNQLSHLQGIGYLEAFDADQMQDMVDYKDLNLPLAERGRAYIAMNCAHCHNPNAWEIPAEKDFDFRYETSLQSSGISSGKDEILRNVTNQEMPFIGTTLLDEEGVQLVTEYIESL